MTSTRVERSASGEAKSNSLLNWTSNKKGKKQDATRLGQESVERHCSLREKDAKTSFSKGSCRILPLGPSLLRGEVMRPKVGIGVGLLVRRILVALRKQYHLLSIQVH